MRDNLRAYPMRFNGRWVIPCVCVAGGVSGGVSRENIGDVMREFERYLDSDEYDVEGDGRHTVTNEMCTTHTPHTQM